MEMTVYTKCLKNHAARIGLCAKDGCLEYYAIPNSFMCGACGCHRNFHERKTVVQQVTPPGPIVVVNNEQQEVEGPLPDPVPRVRRTRFMPSEAQKAAMVEFAERCGWNLKNARVAAVLAFCGRRRIKHSDLSKWIRRNRNQSNH